MGLPGRIKIVRDVLGLSQKELAKKLEISLPALQGYEAGRSVPGGNVFESLARIGFNANWLLTGEGEMWRESSGHVANGNNIIQGAHIDAEELHLAVHRPTAVAEDQHHYLKRAAPDLDRLTKQLRTIIEEYERMRPGRDVEQRARDIAMIYRHFVDNYNPVHDEVEICDYIEGWF